MLRNLIAFYDLAQQALKTTVKSRKKMTWGDILTNFHDLLYELQCMKFKVHFFVKTDI